MQLEHWGMRMKRPVVLFLLTEGFDAQRFNQLSGCLAAAGARVSVAGFARDTKIVSSDRGVELMCDVSFADASTGHWEAVVVGDNATARRLYNSPAAIRLLKNAWARGLTLVAVDEGAVALLGADLVDHQTIAASRKLEKDLRRAGAIISAKPKAVSGRILTASAAADMAAFCRDIVHYTATGELAA
jgi:putative intracellular protease/amidase